MAYISPLPKSDLNVDVWGTDRVTIDRSMFSDIFTHGISDKWNKLTPGNSGIYTEDGSLHMVTDTGGATCILSSRERVRYQPNRGIHYATSTLGLNAVDNNNVRFGTFTSKYGCFFELEVISGVTSIYACVRQTTGVVAPSPEAHTTGYGAATTTTTRYLIPEPEDIDITKNTLWDIRYQWRGAGDIFYYINGRLVFKTERLNKVAGLSISVPALPARFEANDSGGATHAKFGCVDITSEGGQDHEISMRPIVMDASLATVSTTEVGIIGARTGIYLAGIQNSRDAVVRGVEVSSDAAATIRVYILPKADVTATWSIPKSTSALEKGITMTAFTTTNGTLISQRAIAANGTIVIDLEGHGDHHYLTDDGGDLGGTIGDVVIVIAQKTTGGTCIVSVILDLAEDV